MVTQSANGRRGSSCLSSFRFKKNLTLPTLMIFVRRVPVTLLYSQERIAKKKAPHNSVAMAMSTWVRELLRTVSKMPVVIAYCCTGPGSSFSNPFSWRCRTYANPPSSSCLGSGRSLARKVLATLSMAARHCGALRTLKRSALNLPALMA